MHEYYVLSFLTQIAKQLTLYKLKGNSYYNCKSFRLNGLRNLRT
jgi:hypothetical protein